MKTKMKMKNLLILSLFSGMSLLMGFTPAENATSQTIAIGSGSKVIQDFNNLKTNVYTKGEINSILSNYDLPDWMKHDYGWNGPKGYFEETEQFLVDFDDRLNTVSWQLDRNIRDVKDDISSHTDAIYNINSTLFGLDEKIEEIVSKSNQDTKLVSDYALPVSVTSENTLEVICSNITEQVNLGQTHFYAKVPDGIQNKISKIVLKSLNDTQDTARKSLEFKLTIMGLQTNDISVTKWDDETMSYVDTKSIDVSAPTFITNQCYIVLNGERIPSQQLDEDPNYKRNIELDVKKMCMGYNVLQPGDSVTELARERISLDEQGNEMVTKFYRKRKVTSEEFQSIAKWIVIKTTVFN